MTTNAEGFPLLEEGGELLFRQIHPAWIADDGSLTSAAFTPTKKDDGLLSTRREFIGAKRAFDEWVALGLESEGSWAVSIAEAGEQELPVVDDSTSEGSPVGHASIDFRAHSGAQWRKRAGKLRDAAVSRGPVYQPPAAQADT